jgi:DNA-3-methyladenine glycosylase
VYLNYGIHYLVNAVTEAEGCPAAVLIRALEPIGGVPLMRRRRGALVRGGAITRARLNSDETARLCRGPGNLSVALGITLEQNRADLATSALRIEDHGLRPDALAWSPRIGIRVGTDREWRCYWRGNPCVSGKREPVGRKRMVGLVRATG